MAVLLTLICPVYRVRDYIDDLFDSLLCGVNSPEVRLIFVNDCTPDDSMDRLRALLAAHRDALRFDVQCLDLPANRGLAGARNAGLALADSPYIGMIDSDDVVGAHYFSVLRPYLADGRHDLIEFRHAEFTDRAQLPAGASGHELPSSQLNPYRHGFFAWTRIYRADLIGAARFPEGALYEDVPFVAEVFGRVRCSVRLSHVLVGYRRRAGSITTVQLRNRRYAELLIHLVDGTARALPGHARPSEVLALTARQACLVLLKGARIADADERRAFYAACRAPLARLRALCGSAHQRGRAAAWLALAGAGMRLQQAIWRG